LPPSRGSRTLSDAKFKKLFWMIMERDGELFEKLAEYDRGR
jgi:hypothetical protein